MSRKIGEVFSGIKETEILDNTTIVDIIYDRDDYSLVRYALGPNTSIPAERYYNPAVYIVLKGTLELDVIKDGEHHLCEIKKGFGFLRKENQLVGLRGGNEGALCAEVTLRKDSIYSKRLEFNRIFEAKNLVHYEPGQRSILHVIDDELFKVQLIAFSEKFEYEMIVPQEVFIICVEGRADLYYKDKHHILNVGDEFILPRNAVYDVHVSGRSKLCIQYLGEE